MNGVGRKYGRDFELELIELGWRVTTHLFFDKCYLPGLIITERRENIRS